VLNNKVLLVTAAERKVFMGYRQQNLVQWLKTTCQLPVHALETLAGDASFRRYFRVQRGAETYIAVDAPPDRENCSAFVAIANALRVKGLNTPKIIASDLQQGFLLLTDFGDRLYLKELNTTNAQKLYSQALDALAVLQSCGQLSELTIPPFTAEFMVQELQLFKEWFLLKHLNLELTQQQEDMLADTFYFLADSAASQVQVFMHRDFHSANLMLLPDSTIGILDFQDAFIGPVTYDLASLLRDCYIDWPDTFVRQQALEYKARLPGLAAVSDTTFLRWFDLMGMQRHLKALLTFSRKYHRDGSENYLRHIPRTINYVAAVGSLYPECQAFHGFLTDKILSALKKVSVPCEQ
jgi:aminoglycoside/choline kinase family phosphotransferase